LQLRILATGRFHDALSEHHIKARAHFLGLTEPERRKLVRAFAARLALIEQAAPRGRLLTHLAEIHGDLSRLVARALSTSPSPARVAPRVTRDPAQIAPLQIPEALEKCEGA
jgi:catalase